MAKILFIHPYAESNFGRQSIPLALIYTLLKKNGHICEIFDTTFLNNKILREGRPNHEEELTKLNYFKAYDEKRLKSLINSGNIFQMLQDKINNLDPDLITFSFWGSHLHAEGEYFAYQNGLKLINNVQIKEKCKVAVGGTIPSSNPKSVLKSENKIDYVIKGEPELVYLDIANKIDEKKDLNNTDNLNYLSNGELIFNKLRPLIDPLDQLPDVDMGIYDDKNFTRPYHGNLVRMLDFELSRGCWYRCTFCLSPFQRELTYNKAKNFRREKSIDKIIREISSLKRKHRLEFIRYQDESFNSIKENKLKDLSKEYKSKVNLPFIIEATINTSTENRIKYLSEMGCVSVGLGIESGSERLRNEVIIKPKFTNAQAIEVINCYKKHNISVTAYNIIGFPTETKEDVLETINLNYLSKPNYSTMSFFQPWEGTSLKKSSIAEGYLDKDYSESGYSPGQQGGSILNLNTIKNSELKHYHDYFSYYINLPKKMHWLINLSQKNKIFSNFIKFILDLFLKYKKV